jgi:hypothetical protein
MTAPNPRTRSGIDHLTARAVWRESAEAEPRVVRVTLGERTLMFADTADHRPLGHWALSGVRAVTGAEGAMRYAILADGDETLEIRDPAMRAALDAAGRPFPTPADAISPRAPVRRLPWRGPLMLVIAAALLAEAPGLVAAQATRMAPPAQARDFGEEMLDALLAEHGPLCEAPGAAPALAAFADAAAPGARLRVLDLDGAALAAALPGHLVLIDKDALARAAGPAELARWVAQALGPDPGADQTRALMEAVGPVADLRYVFTGTLSARDLARAATAALSPPARADREPATEAARTFPAEDWQALRGICGAA